MVKKKNIPETGAVETSTRPAFNVDWGLVFSWGVTAVLVVTLVLVVLRVNPFKQDTGVVEVFENSPANSVPLPGLASGVPVDTLIRMANIDTSVPEGFRQFPIKYTVEEGDSIFVIAKKFNIEPESILWANYDLLNDDPTFIKEGWRLTIPPTDGIYYKLKEGDSLQKLAEKYYADTEDIITWPSNRLDVTNPTIENLEYVMIPDGYRELVSWIVPLDFSPRSGATKTIPGGCAGPENGLVGSGFFNWPVGSRYLTGFDFTSYHLGIDLAAAENTPVFAADAGTVVYAAWNDSGYGNLVAIDHNNGYKTIYAHLNSILVACGTNVTSGQMIAMSGNTGKSTGSHLHFEIRYLSQYINPWQVLP